MLKFGGWFDPSFQVNAIERSSTFHNISVLFHQELQAEPAAEDTDERSTMSSGLADASFFPTAKELSTGLRWFKDHPVLAAAAATAVSVITYLNATESLAHSRSSSASVLDDTEDDRENDDDSGGGVRATGVFQGGAAGSSSPGGAMYRKRDVGVVVARCRVEVESTSGDKITMTDAITTTTTTLQATGADSDEKLSAAVSWCDEHGGSLTQVFEDLHVTDEWSEREAQLLATERGDARSITHSVEARSGAAAAARDAQICDTNRHVTASLRPVGEAAPVIRKSSTQLSILSAMCSSSDPLAADVPPQQPGDSPMTCSPGGGGDMDLQTESPQWGWYVAITPPQDHLHSNLPRATLQPYRALYPGSNNARVSNAAASNSTLRRSISGKIP